MFSGRKCVVAFACIVLLAAAPLAADEPNEKAAKDAQPAEVECPDEQPEVADDPEKVQYCIETRVVRRSVDANGVDSHRRKEERDGGANTSHLVPQVERAPDPTVVPIERLRAWRAADCEVHQTPVFQQALPPDVMRRWLGSGDSCPLCGKSCSVDCEATKIAAPSPPALTDAQASGLARLQKLTGNAPSPMPLRAGEPAQIILDTQKRLGNSVLEGTEFGDSPELLIQWIRALDEENRRRQATQQARQFESIPVTVQEDLPVTSHSQVSALREACRQLQEAAELLEDQNLFDSADALRAAADDLRHQAREKIGEAADAANDSE